MTWNSIFKEEFNKPYYLKLMSFLKKESLNNVVFPEENNRFLSFNLTPLEKVKVVIIGQDPYHGENEAHGLAFSTLSKKIPPSLKNIYKELTSDLNINYPSTGNLTKWAKEGVLLLNTILTVSKDKPLSHQGRGWETFIERIIKELNKLNRPVVYMLWGNNAIKYEQYLNNHKHLILKSSHPSPFSARISFFNSKPFSKANTFLLDNKVIPIDWKLD